MNFSLFIAAAMSITAIPILGRIMVELSINRTRIGSLTISAAAMDDASGWIILALITAIARSTLNPVRLGLMVVTNLIGIFSIFGAFLLGAILFDQAEFREAVHERARDFVTAFFLPIFFTTTGLRTDIGTMTGGRLWIMCGLVLLTASVGKFGGCSLAARVNGLRWREASMIGMMMNTRALMELVVINLGFDLGVIPKSVFFMLALMAVFTTYITTPVLRRLVRSSELGGFYARSAFAARRGEVTGMHGATLAHRLEFAGKPREAPALTWRR